MLSVYRYSTLDKEMLLSQMLETFNSQKLQGQGHCKNWVWWVSDMIG